MLAKFGPAVPVLLSFEFDDCYYRLRVSPESLAKECLLVVTCRVMFWKSHMRVEKMMREGRGGKLVERCGRIDLRPLVGDGVCKLVEMRKGIDVMNGRLVG